MHHSFAVFPHLIRLEEMPCSIGGVSRLILSVSSSRICADACIMRGSCEAQPPFACWSVCFGILLVKTAVMICGRAFRTLL